MNPRAFLRRASSSPFIGNSAHSPVNRRYSIPSSLSSIVDNSPILNAGNLASIFSGEPVHPDTPDSVYFPEYSESSQASHLLASMPTPSTAPRSSDWSATEFRPPFEQWDSADDLESNASLNSPALGVDCPGLATRFNTLERDPAVRLGTVASGVPQSTVWKSGQATATSCVASPMPTSSFALIAAGSPNPRSSPTQLPTLGRAPSFSVFGGAVAQMPNFHSPLQAHPVPYFGAGEVTPGSKAAISPGYISFLESYLKNDSSPASASSLQKSWVDSPTIPTKVSALSRSLTVKHCPSPASSVNPNFEVGPGLSEANRKNRPAPIYAPALFEHYSIDFFSPEQAAVAVSNYDLLSPDLPENIASGIFGSPPTNAPSCPLPPLPASASAIKSQRSAHAPSSSQSTAGTTSSSVGTLKPSLNIPNMRKLLDTLKRKSKPEDKQNAKDIATLGKLERVMLIAADMLTTLCEEGAAQDADDMDNVQDDCKEFRADEGRDIGDDEDEDEDEDEDIEEDPLMSDYEHENMVNWYFGEGGAPSLTETIEVCKKYFHCPGIPDTI